METLDIEKINWNDEESILSLFGRVALTDERTPLEQICYMTEGHTLRIEYIKSFLSRFGQNETIRDEFLTFISLNVNNSDFVDILFDNFDKENYNYLIEIVASQRKLNYSDFDNKQLENLQLTSLLLIHTDNETEEENIRQLFEITEQDKLSIHGYFLPDNFIDRIDYLYEKVIPITVYLESGVYSINNYKKYFRNSELLNLSKWNNILRNDNLSSNHFLTVEDEILINNLDVETIKDLVLFPLCMYKLKDLNELINKLRAFPITEKTTKLFSKLNISYDLVDYYLDTPRKQMRINKHFIKGNIPYEITEYLYFCTSDFFDSLLDLDLHKSIRETIENIKKTTYM